MIQSDQEIVSVVFPREVYDDWMAESYPNFQRQVRDYPERPILLDLEECEFISPLPILAVATELMTTSESGRVIHINLGSGGAGITAENKARARKYLSLHGFLGAFLTREDLTIRFQFDQHAEAGETGHWYTGGVGLQTLRPLFERASVELLYGESVVVSATTWRLPSGDTTSLSEEIRKEVGHLLRQADASLFRFKTEARKYRDTTLQRLTQVLLELVENVAEHAYLGVNSGFVGLYARVRIPQNIAASAQRTREISKSFLLDRILASEGQHQVEVFVIDVGRGLFADAEHWKGVANVSLRRTPLRRTAQVLFSRPLSRHDRGNALIKEIRGSSTGLMHLDAILSHQHDRTRIITGTEWLAGPHPRGPAFSSGGSYTGGYRLVRTRLAGTVFHIGISPAEIPRLPPPWFTSDDPTQKTVRSAVLNALSSLPKPKTLESRVVDIRRDEVLGDVGAKVLQVSASNLSTVIRLGRVADKNLINAMLDAWVNGVSNSVRDVCALYLCDLGRYQAIDATWVINSFFKKRPIIWANSKRAAIFVVTEDLCCLRLDLSREGGESGPGWLTVLPIAELPTHLASRLFALLRELRVCDSDLLWRRIAQMRGSAEASVLINDVLWERASGPEVLPNYLDFSILVQDREAARYIRRALRRLLALFPEATDLALDSLVEASLHDAKKWLLRPAYEQSARVLVGSLSVSGSTLRRYSKVPGTSVVGAIDCIETPYYNPDSSSYPHVAALLWDPRLEVKTQNRARYRRLAKSAYIEPIKHMPRLDPIEYDENLYQVLESDALLKIGHWSYGERHSLIEINTELAIEQSSASESGAIPWLSREIANVGRDITVIVAFPVHRLAYRLAHNIETRLRSETMSQRSLKLLPLSFLPRVAGGISRLAPLTIERAQNLYSETTETVVFFLDVGFITNRTLRHVVRQFTAIGFRDIRALGLLNRSSAPAFENEGANSGPGSPLRAVPIPKAFWRWNVPTTGTRMHCAICAAIPALGRVRRVIDEAHPDLLPHLELIGDRWRARDVADFWDEYGIRPLPLTEVQLASLAAIRPVLELHNPEVALTSTTVAARVLEYLRFTGDTELPLRVAKALLDGVGDHSAELLCSILVLTGGTLAPADRHDYVSMLIDAAVREIEHSLDTDTLDRRSRLNGLVGLVFVIQSSRCKLEVIGQLVSKLWSFEVRDPVLRIALVALTTDSDESTRVQDAFAAMCADAPLNSTLRRNYLALRPVRANVRETWVNLTHALGRSEAHSQHSVIGKLLAQVRVPRAERSEIVLHLQQLSSLLGQCDPRFVLHGFGLNLRELVDGARTLEKLAAEPGIVNELLERKILDTFQAAFEGLHRSLPRYGDRAKYPLIYMLFKDVLRECALPHKLDIGDDIVLTLEARLASWPLDHGDYLPLCGHIIRLFDEIMSNVASKAVCAIPPDERSYAELEASAKCWLHFDTSSESLRNGMSLIFVNCIDKDLPVRPYEAKVADLRDFGVNVASRHFESQGRAYYEVRVRIPSLTSILETV